MFYYLICYSIEFVHSHFVIILILLFIFHYLFDLLTAIINLFFVIIIEKQFHQSVILMFNFNCFLFLIHYPYQTLVMVFLFRYPYFLCDVSILYDLILHWITISINLNYTIIC